MKKRKIIIGTRGSKLALIYAFKAKKEIINNSQYSNDDILIKEIVTKGDQIKNQRLSDIGGKGLFSKNIEDELREKKIDIAVHALKDMPAEEPDDLITNSFLKRNDPREILISYDNKTFNELKSNSIIGTSSFRREFQIKKIRSDINCKLIRGNVDTRIKKLKDRKYDGILLSYAGLISLNLHSLVTQIFSTDEFIPSAGQGIIALQCRKKDEEIISVLEKINDKQTYKCAIAERNVLKVLSGDCETAIGVHATLNDTKIVMVSELFSIDGSKRFYKKVEDDQSKFNDVGIEIGNFLKLESKNCYKK
jgi:hydroxymethylbilane synthase